MDKHEALSRLAALESEAKALRTILEAPEPPSSLLTKPIPARRGTYGVMDVGNYDRLGGGGKGAASAHSEHYTHGNVFQSKKLAADYADAINTLLLLRHQPGTEPVKCGGGAKQAQFYIRPRWVFATSSFDLRVESRQTAESKLTYLCPAFATVADAERAITVLGGDTILRMFFIFSHYEV